MIITQHIRMFLACETSTVIHQYRRQMILSAIDLPHSLSLSTQSLFSIIHGSIGLTLTFAEFLDYTVTTYMQRTLVIESAESCRISSGLL